MKILHMSEILDRLKEVCKKTRHQRPPLAKGKKSGGGGGLSLHTSEKFLGACLRHTPLGRLSFTK